MCAVVLRSVTKHFVHEHGDLVYLKNLMRSDCTLCFFFFCEIFVWFMVTVFAAVGGAAPRRVRLSATQDCSLQCRDAGATAIGRPGPASCRGVVGRGPPTVPKWARTTQQPSSSH